MQAIATAHGGTVRAADTDTGAQLEFELPGSRPARAAHQPAPPDRMAARR